ncbi:uncharacterized protein LOC132061418 [Lycium ferocissimum]|uniref:uncharacterized protein LOC132061418 n=1 Tax=Lycium ferocissimum TaxID=112874 RepID=UPI00281624BA|nr:uncharacterized protein LOC132061418 [Lycium ferocissimum]
MADVGQSGHVNNTEIVAENEGSEPRGLPNLADPDPVNSREGLNRQNTVDQENAALPATDPLRTHNSVTLSRTQSQREPEAPNDGINLRLIFEMLQEQRAAIAEQGMAIARLQSGQGEAGPEKAKGAVEIGRNEPRMVESDDSRAGSSTEVLKMLETLAKRVDSTEKRVETYNSRVDQIPGAPPLLKGPNSKRYVQRPFPPSAAPKLIPKRFKMPDIQKYNGTTDPHEHVTSYTCAIKGNDMEEDEIESVLLKKFGETLSKGALTWYDHLPEHSITSFEMLADAFVKAHAGAIKVQARKADIFRITQRDDELLREFVTRFQRERMELPPVPEEWAAQAFTKGLNMLSSVASAKLKENLLEYEAITWADVHNRYESKIRVEDDQFELSPIKLKADRGFEKPRRGYEAKSESSKERFRPYSHPERSNSRSEKPREGPSHFSGRGSKLDARPLNSRGLSFRSDTGSSASNKGPPRISEYNFNVSTSDLVSAISRISNVRWLKPLKTDPGQGDPSMVCEYHGTHGHKTEDCRHLREEVARLLKNGHLRDLLSERARNYYKGREVHQRVEPVEHQHIINMIVGGIDIPRVPIMKRTKISIIGEKRTRDHLPGGSISFDDGDAEGIIQPHNDLCGNFVLIFKTKVKRILIDPGSSANIIRWRVVEQLGLLDRIVPATRVLSGFNMASETTKGEISLPVNIEAAIQQTLFYVIEGDMKYNALLGRPWIHSMRAVPSTLHQLLKFPTLEGVKTIRGEQPAAKEMFAVEESVPRPKEPARKEMGITGGEAPQ